jgi:hypothetical protein
MFAVYLADIEQLLDAQRREVALREALDLPRIAIALADPLLRCTREQLQRWCEEWIRPPGAERDAQGLDYERLSCSISERLAQVSEPDGVPMRALRRSPRPLAAGTRAAPVMTPTCRRTSHGSRCCAEAGTEARTRAMAVSCAHNCAHRSGVVA